MTCREFALTYLKKISSFIERRGDSLSSFDVLNTVVAALRDGVMPLYNLYIVNQLGLGPVHVAWLMSTASASSFVSQMPIGLLYDRVPSARGPLAGGLIGLAASSGLMYFARGQSLAYLLLAQAIFGIATAVLSQGIPAITVAETSAKKLGGRVARNEVFAKIGSLSALALAGYMSRTFSLRTVFVFVPALVVPAVYLILRAQVSKVVREPKRAVDWVPPRGVWALLGVTFLLYFSNSAALTIFEQLFGRGRDNGGASFVALGAALAQGTITVTILSLTRVKSNRGLVGVMGVTFALVIARVSVMSIGPDVVPLIASQVLDGVIGGVVFTVPMRLLAHLDRAQFNVLSGILGSAAALGATSSMFLSGYLLSWLEYPGALLVFVAPAALGILVSWTYRAELAASRT